VKTSRKLIAIHSFSRFRSRSSHSLSLRSRSFRLPRSSSSYRLHASSSSLRLQTPSTSWRLSTTSSSFRSWSRGSEVPRSRWTTSSSLWRLWRVQRWIPTRWTGSASKILDFSSIYRLLVFVLLSLHSQSHTFLSSICSFCTRLWKRFFAIYSLCIVCTTNSSNAE